MEHAIAFASSDHVEAPQRKSCPVRTKQPNVIYIKRDKHAYLEYYNQ